MRIAIVINSSWNIYNFRSGLIRALQRKGHSIHAVAPRDEYTSKIISAGCHFTEVPMNGAYNPFKDLLLFFRLILSYRKIKPDAILHYTIKPNIYGTFAAALLGIPVINNVCGLGTTYLQKNLISKVVLTLYKMAFHFPRKIYFQNQADLSYFVEKGLVNRLKCEIIPGSGLSLTDFKPQPLKKPGKFRFLLMSRLIYDKGIVEFIEAIKLLKKKGFEAEFEILGATDPGHKRGISEKQLQEWIDKRLINYLGATEDVRPFIGKVDCVVLPSYREGISRTLLEGASMEKPLIASAVAGCTEIVKHGYNGLLCQPQNSVDLAHKMEQLFKLMPEERLAMGKKGRQLVKRNYNEKLVVNKYLCTIDQIKSDLVKNP